MPAAEDLPRKGGVNKKTCVLFVGEAVTLAHVARPLALAQALDRDQYDIHFASSGVYSELWPELPFSRSTIYSISGEQFLGALAQGRPLYDAKTLRRYVEEELALLSSIAPDIVVGDFRLSLSVSARITGTPFVTVTNAYWSPYARQNFPLPELPINKITGLSIANGLFKVVRPVVFAMHSRPLNRVRKEYGLQSLGKDLTRVYTDADYVLYADIPELFPTYDLPSTHRYLGPVIGAPAVSFPSWWNDVPTDKTCIYITLGSSGKIEVLGKIADALEDLPLIVLVATAGRKYVGKIPGNWFVSDFLPGTDASARASLVICNGGSPTTHQALACGVPVLGIPSNMDQHLNMAGVEKVGAGRLVRSDRSTVLAIRQAVEDLLGDPGYKDAAVRIAGEFSRYDFRRNFREFVHSLVP